jgi:hypothetical protein
MKSHAGIYLSIIAIAGSLTLVGCGKKPEPKPDAGLAERTGTKLDEVAKKGATKAEVVAEKTKDVAGKAVEKTGNFLEKVGGAVEKAGEKLQK